MSGWPTTRCSPAGSSRSGRLRCYPLRLERSIKREFGFAKRPNNMFNPARFARSDSQGSALSAG